LGLLSRNLQSKNAGFITQPSNEDIPSKPPHRRTSSNNTNHTNGFTQNFNSSFSDVNQGSNPTSSNYLTSDSQLTHQSTPYPAATQYYPDPPAASATQYSAPETHSYSAYPPALPDSVEAPLLAAFAAQASQVAPSSWRSSAAAAASVSASAHSASGSQSWQAWTSTMAGNLEPQDCYSASALMQLGGRDLAGQDAPELAALQQGHQQVLVHGQGGEMGGVAAGVAGVAWPLNIFDLGTAGSSA